MHWAKNFWLVAAMLSVGVAGCTKESGPTYYPVTGQVTFEGEPVQEGSIIFLSEDDPELPPVGGTIVDGTYTLKAYAGQFKVQINASREDPEKTIPSPGGEDVLVMEQYLPEKYNTKTELTADVAPVTPNTIDFELTE